MKAISTPFEGLFLFEPTVFGDTRGYFFEAFNLAKFDGATGQSPAFVQDNESMSARSVLRGLHFQIEPKAQGKLVRVVSGAVLDIVVDIRPGSKTFGQTFRAELTSENRLQMWIPPGFAHGFVTLKDNTVFQYKVTDYWSPEHERCIAWNDPDLAIDWGFDGTPLVSAKDAQGMSWAEFKKIAGV